MSMDFYTFGTKRITAYGCQDGFLYISENKEAEQTSIKSTRLDGPISCVKMYRTDRLSESYLQKKSQNVGENDDENEDEMQVNLVVAVTVGYSIIFRHALI